jgi:hypothetical protein
MRCTLPSYRRAGSTDKKETGNASFMFSLCGLLSCEDYLLNWFTLGHFMVCRRVGCGSNSRNSLPVDRNRFSYEGLIFATAGQNVVTTIDYNN